MVIVFEAVMVVRICGTGLVLVVMYRISLHLKFFQATVKEIAHVESENTWLSERALRNTAFCIQKRVLGLCTDQKRIDIRLP
jgi:hypothetical protein